MIVEIVSIGDELLNGQTVNSNAAYLGRELTAVGLDVRHIITVGDDAVDLEQALEIACGRSEVVITTGGLGPTHDDITKTVAARFFESELIEKPEIVERLQKAFAKRGFEMPAINREQARVPAKADLIDNSVGTAPGFIFRKDDARCFILPGVPAEMRSMTRETVLPMLRGGGTTVLQKTVRTTGIPESALFEAIGDIDAIQELARVAFLPRLSGVDIRLIVRDSDAGRAENRIAQAKSRLYERIGAHIYGEDDRRLEEVVASELVKQRKSVAVAESCTGGLLAHKLTNISGSSDYFERGVVTYSNEAKMTLLGVAEATLESHGAVSAETAEEMAHGMRRSAGTNFALSTTGIAGPTGGTREKPVGLIYIGIAGDSGVKSKRYVFTKDRSANKIRSVQAALHLFLLELTGRGEETK